MLRRSVGAPNTTHYVLAPVIPIPTVPDTPLPAMATYSLAVQLPAVPAGNYTVQTIYFTNNAAAPPAFFQCSSGESRAGRPAPLAHCAATLPITFAWH